jgi:hypothetical protein
MGGRYHYVGNGVIQRDSQFFRKADSSKTFESKFLDEERQYEISFKDITIELETIGHFTDAVLITYSRDNNKPEDKDLPITSFIDMLVCTHLGTFISDWY